MIAYAVAIRREDESEYLSHASSGIFVALSMPAVFTAHHHAHDWMKIECANGKKARVVKVEYTEPRILE